MTETAGSMKVAVGRALTAGKRKTGAARPRPGGLMLQLQRSAEAADSTADDNHVEGFRTSRGRKRTTASKPMSDRG